MLMNVCVCTEYPSRFSLIHILTASNEIYMVHAYAIAPRGKLLVTISVSAKILKVKVKKMLVGRMNRDLKNNVATNFHIAHIRSCLYMVF